MSEKKLQKEVLTNLIFHYFQGRANPIRRAGVLQAALAIHGFAIRGFDYSHF